MKTPKNVSRHEKLRQAALRQIKEINPFIEGALCSFKRKGCAKPGWHLTYKHQGRTKTVYVPIDMVAEVKAWCREYKRLKQLIRKTTKQSLGIIRSHVASRSAARRGQALIRALSAKNSRLSAKGRSPNCPIG